MILANEAVLTALLVAVLASAVPLMLAAIGEAVGQQSGVLNVGLEGVMLVGAYFGFVAAHATGGLWLGLLVGALAGAALAAVLLVLSVWLGVNQIVVGIGMMLAGMGVTSMLYESRFASSKPRIGQVERWSIPGLSDLPVVGPAVFAQPGMLYMAFIVPVLVSLWLYRTMPGLRLRAAGQRPASLDAMGGSVMRSRAVAVMFGGVMGGLGGAYLSLISAGTFTPGMTHGVGFLAIVLAMLARGRMLALVLIALGYGALVGLGTALQLAGFGVSNELIAMLPFAAVLVVLAFGGSRAGGRSAVPPALAQPYIRGAR